MRGEKRAVQNQRIAKVVFTMSDGDAICFSLYCGRDFPRHGRQKQINNFPWFVPLLTIDMTSKRTQVLDTNASPLSGHD